MGCFTATIVEAVAASAVAKSIKAKEEKEGTASEMSVKIPLSRKVGWLSNMLWGGSALLAFEHLWHGEVVPFPPFLTAMSNPADMMEMLKEIACTGTTMVLLVTAVWAAMVGVVHVIEKKSEKRTESARTVKIR